MHTVCIEIERNRVLCVGYIDVQESRPFTKVVLCMKSSLPKVVFDQRISCGTFIETYIEKMHQYKTIRGPHCSRHRRRINTEEKAKFVAADWGTK